MKCPNCKQEIPDDTILCPNCTYNVTDYDKDESFLETVKNVMNKKREVTSKVNSVVPIAAPLASRFILMFIISIIQSIVVVPIILVLGLFLFSSYGDTKYKLVSYESKNGGYVGVYVSEKNSNKRLEVDDVYQTKEEVPQEYYFDVKKDTPIIPILVFLGIVILVEILVIRAVIKAYKKYKNRQDTNV